MSLNIVLNILGTAIIATVGLVTLPLLIGRLGFEAYGLWALITAASTYVALLDFGFSASLARLIAAKRASDNVEAINCLMSTALAVLLLLGCLSAALTLLTAHDFLSTFNVPLSRQVDTYRALVIMVLGICANLPLSIFQALGFGYERFDLENLIDIGTVVSRAILLFVLIDHHSGLTEVALLTAGPNLAGAIAGGLVARHIEPRFRLRPANVRWFAFRELYAFALPCWTVLVTKIVPPQIGPLVIGHFMGGESVATFTIARQLVAYCVNLVMAAGRTMTPRAALLQAAGQEGAKRSLFTDASRYAFAMAMILTCGVISFGQIFLSLWLGAGPGPASTYHLLVILAIGEAFPMSQCITAAVLSGLGRNSVLVVTGLCETIVIAAMSVALAGRYGLAGICVAYAVAGTLVRGVAQMVWGCRIIGVSVASYLSRVVLMVLVAGAIPLSIGAAIARQSAPNTYAQVLLCAVVYSAIQALFLVPLLLNVGSGRRITSSLPRFLGGSAGHERARTGAEEPA